MPVDRTRSSPSPVVSGPRAPEVEQFERRVAEIIVSAPRNEGGHPQLRESDIKDLRRAATDLLVNVPVDDFSPEAVERIERALASRGVAPGSLAGKSLRDLGRDGREAAKELLRDLKEDSPAAYYGLAGAVAIAVGYTGYHQGSDGLRNLGIRPELKTRLFNDQVSVRIRASWEEKFREPAADLQVSGQLANDLGRLSVDGRVNGDGIRQLGARYELQRDQFEFGATVRHDFARDVTQAGLEARYQPKKNVEVSVDGSVDSEGNRQANVKLKIKF